MTGGVAAWLAGWAAAGAVLLAFPARHRLAPPWGTQPTVGSTRWTGADAVARAGGERGGRRLLWSVLAALGGPLFVAGPVGLAAGLVVGVGTWVVLGRAETPESRRTREQVRRELPHLVDLLASTLRGGAAPGEGVAVVCAALPGAAADRLGGVTARLSLGLDPVRVWESLLVDPDLAPLGRTLARAHATGAPVVPAVERLADDLAQRSRAEVEQRARTVGVRAALPLGLCLLPAFLLIGIVPLVAGLLSTLAL